LILMVMEKWKLLLYMTITVTISVFYRLIADHI
jgi:hypothetical protein